VALIGGVDRDSLPDTGTSTPLPGVQTFDEANPGAGWTTGSPLNHGRAHHNTVQLPDRSMVTVGGGYGILNGNRRSGDAAIHRNIELYDPATGQWTLGPAQDELRTYHSTALLLPDGRVLSAGDDGYGGSSNDTAEVYEPPYLFKGLRPSIASAPDAVTYGDTFTVDASADATRAVLMAPAAVTHANDMSQRHVPVAAAAGPAGTLTVTAPAAPELAPPTFYMLFALNDQGVPSVARFIRLKLGRADAPVDPPAPPAADATPPETSIVSGPSASTASPAAIHEFVSSEPWSNFECRLDGGDWKDCASPAGHPPLPAGPHSFEVRATDAAGNTDPTPAAWTWTILGGAALPPDPAGPTGAGLGLPASPGIPAATAQADRTPPVLHVRTRSVRRTRVTLEVACPAEACTTTVRGRVELRGAARAFKLTPASVQLRQGGRARVALRFAQAIRKRVRRALRPLRRVRVRVHVRASDAAGNTTTRRKVVLARR
jgi:hypothetical protein